MNEYKISFNWSWVRKNGLLCDDQISQIRMRRISASRYVVDVILRKADANGMTTYTYEMNQIQALSVVSDMTLLGSAFEDLT